MCISRSRSGPGRTKTPWRNRFRRPAGRGCGGPTSPAALSPYTPATNRCVEKDLLDAGRLHDADLVRAVVVHRGAEELQRLALGGAPRQVPLNEVGRLVCIVVDAVAQPIAGDLAEPGELVLRLVDPEAVDGGLER